MQAISSQEQLKNLARILSGYLRLPISVDSIPGAFVESAIAHVKCAERLNTYDYVDVVDRKNGIGWSIKSSKEATPVTWKRAKIPNQQRLIDESRSSENGLQRLGNAIIDFCNDHARQSMKKFNLSAIVYSRLVLMKSGRALYFEKQICSDKNYNIFEPDDFTWFWSKQKVGVRKEQLQSLHGIHRKSNSKWWAWHGLGENQLHFSGERAWWPNEGSSQAFYIDMPASDSCIGFDELIEFLDRIAPSI